MKSIKKQKYTLETLSTVVLSPREQECFFVKEKNVKTEDTKGKEINIIYPFYQYGIYEEYKKEEARYYIPGSSIKGAVIGFNKKEKEQMKHIMFDDIPIENKDIGLYHLYKVQYMISDRNENKQKKIKIDTFFPNIGVEMLKANRWYTGEVFLQGSFQEYLEKTKEITKGKIENFCARIDKLKNNNMREDNKKILDALKKEIENIKKKIEQAENKDEYYIFLGGYKGFLLSARFDNEMLKDKKNANNIEEVSSAIYIDKEKNLPHGLVKIKLSNS